MREKKNRFRLVPPILILLLLCASGCNSVHRRLSITSEPSGARVWINDQEVGRTPISQNVVYSGTYKIRCEQESCETTTVMHDVRTPWYLYPGVDFLSENFVPGELRDNQKCHVVLPPKRVVPDNELLEAANKMRSEAQGNVNLRTYQNQNTVIP
ncbi:MAG: PEGA domain-containing protein [Planctomycetia bacterium]|nr:PEGA domain-containing protein [Planctomycetia bacterium]